MNEYLKQRLLIKKRKMAEQSACDLVNDILKQKPADKEFIKRLMGNHEQQKQIKRK